ncbi:MAG TPA: hypothetical protein VH916_06440, partial [Dehalococcoidia bacterium]
AQWACRNRSTQPCLLLRRLQDAGAPSAQGDALGRWQQNGSKTTRHWAAVDGIGRHVPRRFTPKISTLRYYPTPDSTASAKLHFATTSRILA